MSEFEVQTPEGRRPALEVVSDAARYKTHAEDSDKAEYAVRVEWLDTKPESEAVKRGGFFGNQNTVCRPTAAKWRHTIERLTREIEELKERAVQGELFDEAGRLAAIEQSIEEKTEEIDRRRQHYEEIREQLHQERTRILDHLLPKRFAMASEAQVFPVAVEIRLPEQPR